MIQQQQKYDQIFFFFFERREKNKDDNDNTANTVANMEFSENLESFSHLNNDPFCNLLDEEIPQNIFDELMNDALGFDINSVSSEDSGRSSSSYDDLGSRLDTFGDQAMLELPQIKTELIKQEHVEEEPKSPHHFIYGSNNINNHNVNINVSTATEPIEVSHSAIFATKQQTFSQIQQPKFVLSQPKIVVKQEPIKFHTQSNTQQIFTLQTVNGQQFVVTNANQTPVHTIVNGTTGILTKIPVVPVTSIIQQQPLPTPQPITTLERTNMTTVVRHPTKLTVKPTTNTIVQTVKPSKKSGHNIIERRYRTSIVCIFYIIRIFPFFPTFFVCWE